MRFSVLKCNNVAKKKLGTAQRLLQKNILDQNHYEVLGLPNFAPLADIKAAIRKLSKRYHPDLNPGDKEAERKFKDITLARSVLESPEDKKHFDDKFPFKSRPQGSTTNQNYTGRQGAKTKPSGRQNGPKGDFTSKQPIIISWAEMLLGCEKKVKLRGPQSNPVSKTFTIRIQPSLKPKSIRFKSMGYPNLDGISFGDQIVPVRLQDPNLYKIEGKNLICTLPISVFEAELGIAVRYRHLTGVEKIITIDRGTTSGKRIVIEKLGVPWVAMGRQELSGDLILIIKVLKPKKSNLTKKNVQLLDDLHAEFWPSGIRSAFNKQARE